MLFIVERLFVFCSLAAGSRQAGGTNGASGDISNQNPTSSVTQNQGPDTTNQPSPDKPPTLKEPYICHGLCDTLVWVFSMLVSLLVPIGLFAYIYLKDRKRREPDEPPDLPRKRVFKPGYEGPGGLYGKHAPPMDSEASSIQTSDAAVVPLDGATSTDFSQWSGMESARN